MRKTADFRQPARMLPARAALLVFLAAISLPPCLAAELQKDTVRAWDRYLEWTQQRVARELSRPDVFLFLNTLPAAEKTDISKRLGAGEIVAGRMQSSVPKGTAFEVPSGEIHHWWGAVLLKNMRLEKLLEFLQDYDHHAGKFADVERSRLISRDGDHYRFFFRLRRTKAIVTAYYNTDQECRYARHGTNRLSSESQAVRIAEIEDAGKAAERELPPGNDRGFLWRLASWWRFEQRGPDVLIELESASLSRDIPYVARVIPGVSSYIRSTPKESLESVLISIRKEMMGR